MKIMKTKKTNQQNSGFSLVELVVAIGILAVIGTIVAFMMSSSSRNYRRMSLEAQLQSEAQLVANTVTEYAIDAYTAADVISDNSLNSTPYKKDKGKVMHLKSKEVDLSGNSTVVEYVIALNDTSHELYLSSRSYPDAAHPTVPAWGTFSLLGSHIADFNVDTSKVSTENMLVFQIDYTKSERTYNGNYQVLMRNRAYKDAAATPVPPGGRPDFSMMLGLSPKQVYIDISEGKAGKNYYINSIADANARALAAQAGTSGISPIQIPLISTVTSSDATDTGDVDWVMNGISPGIFDLAETTENGIVIPSTNKFDYHSLYFINGVNYDANALGTDNFSVSISKSKVYNGQTYSSPAKTTNVYLRRVKSVKVAATAGVMVWQDQWTKMGYKPCTNADVKQYAYANSIGEYNSVNLNATVEQKWVFPHDGKLLWTIEPVEGVPYSADDYQGVRNSYAYLTSYTTDNVLFNTIKFGSKVKPGMAFKVTVTTEFDPSKYAEFYVGVSPYKDKYSYGYNSRGYEVNVNEYFQWLFDDTIDQDRTDIHIPPRPGAGFNIGGDAYVEFVNPDTGAKDLTSSAATFKYAVTHNLPMQITVGTNAGDNFDLGSFHSYVNADGDTIFYCDYSSSQYGNASGNLKFFTAGNADLEIFITATFPGNVQKKFTMYYYFAPVNVHGWNKDRNIYVLDPDEAVTVETCMDYYNILGPEYVGIYILESDGKGETKPNYNKNNQYDAHSYLKTQLVSDPGNVQKYKNMATVTITAKTPNNVRNADPMVVRIAADKYYTLLFADENKGEKDKLLAGTEYATGNRLDQSIRYRKCPKEDYTIVESNVIGDKAFIVGPATSSTIKNVTGFPTFDKDVIRTKTRTNAQKIGGYDSRGNYFTVDAFYSGGAYKCIYKGVEYTYNMAYHYWSK